MKLIIAVLFSSFFTSALFALEIGESLPKLDPKISKMRGVDEKEYDLSSLMGKKGLLVIFSCNHCPYVKAWEDRTRDVGNKYLGDLAVIQINSNDFEKYPEDSFEKMKERAQEKTFKFPYVVDASSQVAKAFGATKTPEFYLFNTDRKLVYHGALDDDHRAGKQKRMFLESAIQNLLAGKPIDPAKTNSVGCGIKFRS